MTNELINIDRIKEQINKQLCEIIQLSKNIDFNITFDIHNNKLKVLLDWEFKTKDYE
jgi:hypothetical protein